jgi:hypothetical protein
MAVEEQISSTSLYTQFPALQVENQHRTATRNEEDAADFEFPDSL